MKKEILTKTEVILMVDSFYAKVKVDPLIGPIFIDIAKVDWEEHMPRLYDFWAGLLFQERNYKGRPFPPHMHLNLKREHFVRWLELFVKTVDENFYGPKAEETKVIALNIAKNFMFNLGIIQPE